MNKQKRKIDLIYLNRTIREAAEIKKIFEKKHEKKPTK